MNDIDKSTKDKIKEVLENCDPTTVLFAMFLLLFSAQGVDISGLEEQLKNK